MDPFAHAHPLHGAGHGLITAGAVLARWRSPRAACRCSGRRSAWPSAGATHACGWLLAAPALAGGRSSRWRRAGSSRPPAGRASRLRSCSRCCCPWRSRLLACALVAALAPKAVMRRTQPPERLLRRPAGPARSWLLAIALVTAGLARSTCPALARRGRPVLSGPFGASTRSRCASSTGRRPGRRRRARGALHGARRARRHARARRGPHLASPWSAGRGPSTAPGRYGEGAPAPRRAHLPSHPTATRAGTGQIAPSSVQQRTTSRTDRIPTVSPPSRTIRWRKPPRTIAAAASSRDQSGAA